MENTSVTECPKPQTCAGSVRYRTPRHRCDLRARGGSPHKLVHVGPYRGVWLGVVWANLLSPSPKWPFGLGWAASVRNQRMAFGLDVGPVRV